MAARAWTVRAGPRGGLSSPVAVDGKLFFSNQGGGGQLKNMQRAILCVALAVVFVAGVSAQGKPNFAGMWKASDSFTSWTITVEGSKMTVTMTVAGNSDSQVYMLDGTPSTTKMEGPNGISEIVYTSTWEGDVLATTIAAPQMIRIERRSIEADGTMKVHSTITMMQGKPVPPGGPSPPPMVLKRIGEPE